MSVFNIEEMTYNLDEHEYVKRSKDSYKRSLAMQGVGCCMLIGGLCLLFLELFIGGLMFAGETSSITGESLSHLTTTLILSLQCSDSYAWVNIVTMASYAAIAFGVALINYGVIMAGFNWIAMGIGFSAVNTKSFDKNAKLDTQSASNASYTTVAPDNHPTTNRPTYYRPQVPAMPQQPKQNTNSNASYEEKLLNQGGWQCDCGLVHASYVSSCGCGKNKREVLSSKKK